MYIMLNLICVCDSINNIIHRLRTKSKTTEISMKNVSRANMMTKNAIRYIPIYIILLLYSAGCTGSRKDSDRTIFVSIAPLKCIVHEIVGEDFDIEILVPSGASPESFEPTPKQFIALNSARLVFNVGLIDFERNLMSKISDPQKITDLSQGIELIAGSCSHNHHGHGCRHGIDPHIWSSPQTLKIMARNAYEAIHKAYPDSVKYETAYIRLNERLEILDKRVSDMCANARNKYFIIYHPALTYFARDYGIEQVAIEHEGKEPSVKRLSDIIDKARRDNIGKVFYQTQFPRTVVETVASDIDAEPTEIDPLKEDVFENIESIARLITE